MTATSITRDVVKAKLEGQKADIGGAIFKYLLIACLGLVLASLVALVVSVAGEGADVLIRRGIVDFITDPFSINERRAGISQGMVGTITCALIVPLLAFPIGVGSAIYLEEYASDNALTRTIDVVIRNLAGVPAVVFGLLGLAVFVTGPFRGLTGGSSLLAASFTLAILILPIVVITSAEAIRAVPSGLREGGYGVGATRWEVTRTLVLPNALGGILTGTILALARALGEAAPLILVGAKTSGFSGGDFGDLTGSFTALPSVITDWAGRPAQDWTGNTQAAILVTLVVVLGINTIAIVLRNRLEKKD